MNLITIEFIGFTLGTVLLYYCVPLKWRWMALLVASIAFYLFSGWKGMVYLVGVTVVTYLSALILEASHKRQKKVIERHSSAHPSGMAEGIRSAASSTAGAASPKRAISYPTASMPLWTDRKKNRYRKRCAAHEKAIVSVVILICVGVIAFLKYYNATFEWLNQAFAAIGLGGGLTQLSLIVPLGLSYFTFQSLGYVIDVYRKKYAPEKNFFKYFLFVSFFPQLTQGPISSYPQLSKELYTPHRFEADSITMGFQLILWGFFKKLVIADRLAVQVNYVFRYWLKLPGWYIMFGVLLYLIQLYADFSGGIDIVRGVARMMGIDMVDNFKRPFFASSVADYWRRWHISLATWFKTYLFYPLALSRLGRALGRLVKRQISQWHSSAIPGWIGVLLLVASALAWRFVDATLGMLAIECVLLIAMAIMVIYWFKWYLTPSRIKFYVNDEIARRHRAANQSRQQFARHMGNTLPGAIATVLVFVIIGIWHTANWNCVYYGLYYGVLLAFAMLLEPFFKRVKRALHINDKAFYWRIFGILRTLVIVWFGQYFARTASPAEAFQLIARSFEKFGAESFMNLGVYKKIDPPMIEVNIAVAAIGVLFLVDLLKEWKVPIDRWVNRSPLVIKWSIWLALLFATLIFGKYGNGYDSTSFLYMQF